MQHSAYWRLFGSETGVFDELYFSQTNVFLRPPATHFSRFHILHCDTFFMVPCFALQHVFHGTTFCTATDFALQHIFMILHSALQHIFIVPHSALKHTFHGTIIRTADNVSLRLSKSTATGNFVQFQSTHTVGNPLTDTLLILSAPHASRSYFL